MQARMVQQLQNSRSTPGHTAQPMESVAVVAVPFPAQGHLNALLHLSLQLAARGLPVHYAAPAEQVRQARARVHGWGDDALHRVTFHELPIPAYASPPPADPATADSAFPSHLMPMWEAFTAGAPAPLDELLAGLSASHRRVAVVYDLGSAFAAEAAARLPNGEGFGLLCTAVSSIIGGSDAGSRLLRTLGLDYLPINNYVTQEFLEYASERARVAQAVPSSAGVLTNTCRALEAEFLDVFAGEMAAAGKKLFAVGPLNPVLLETTTTPEQREQHGTKKTTPRHECLDWLDGRPPASVLYVSFGSTSSLRAEQVAELAAALRDSSQRFIWVLRDADRGNIFADDDHGETGRRRHARFLAEFAKQTQGRGLVITGWAPQLEILAHGATAAFLSHCGWNSTMESLSHGKPILAWPMHSDQPWDAELVCKHLNAGLLVRPIEKQREVVPATAILGVIQKMMVSDEGKVVRQRAVAIGEAIRGSSSKKQDLESFIAHITR